MVDRSELVLGQHVVVRLCGGETVGAVVDGLCNDWVGVRLDRGGYVIADWEDIEVEVDAEEEVVRTEQGEVLAVKKASTEDMPYVADEHFFEREPADTFKYRLAEYMTKNCKKVEGPYGYSYNISSESILQMAKDELIKRGELKEQKPVEKQDYSGLNELERAIHRGFLVAGVEDVPVTIIKETAQDCLAHMPAWSEEDEKMLNEIITIMDGGKVTSGTYLSEYVTWLKSLRPQWKPTDVCYGIKGDPDPAGVWKPTEEQMKAIDFARRVLFETYPSQHNGCEPYHILGELYEQLKRLM